MKGMKTLKKLKFWSKKKKKKKLTNVRIDHHPMPCSCCCCHHHHDNGSHTVQPSAPLLPTWQDYEEQTYNHHLLASEVNFSSFPGFPSNPQQDETSAPTDPGDVETSCSYQQYMVQNPVYGTPVLPPTRTDRSAGTVGCVFSIGTHLLRCFFPCFRIREA